MTNRKLRVEVGRLSGTTWFGTIAIVLRLVQVKVVRRFEEKRN
jgi:hypothetical protein